MHAPIHVSLFTFSLLSSGPIVAVKHQVQTYYQHEIHAHLARSEFPPENTMPKINNNDRKLVETQVSLAPDKSLFHAWDIVILAPSLLVREVVNIAFGFESSLNDGRVLPSTVRQDYSRIVHIFAEVEQFQCSECCIPVIWLSGAYAQSDDATAALPSRNCREWRIVCISDTLPHLLAWRW
jgi:hypothetical protein